MLKAFLIGLDGVLRIWATAQDTGAEQAAGLPSGSIKQVAFATPYQSACPP
jgi:hypothetical protein